MLYNLGLRSDYTGCRIRLSAPSPFSDNGFTTPSLAAHAPQGLLVLSLSEKLAQPKCTVRRQTWIFFGEKSLNVIQVQYWEKARSDNPPHVFAVADRAYQQMLHHKRSQVIITFGKCGSGKSFSATQIINQLAFLSPVSMNHLIISFGDSSFGLLF
ncbi:hypothetical protein AVEN_186872-1 [Araneus ventricosus]|uniref:Myosin motor domain-containing protein n=1 Tax=Araneus ventricosus TaxID=182803 RepID=A0A4Y2MYV8_ARAVE|nr:hypothetical protein AVEN_186872-1 [Araneus ventricosus]